MKTKFFFMILVILIGVNLASAFTGNSSSYTLELGNVNYAAYDGNSSSYNASFSLIDQPIAKGSNSSYNVELGFFSGDFVYTPPETPGPPTGGGKGAPGGGTSRLIKDYTFMLMQETIKVTIKQGGSERRTLQIRNKGDAYQEMKIFQEGLSENLIIPENEFLLDPGGVLKIPLQFFASERQEPGIYQGKLRVMGERDTKLVIVIVDVLPKEALFDIKVEVKENSKEVNAGDSVEVEMKLFNLGDLKPVDVELNYSILNDEGRVIDFAHETLAVENEVSLIRSLKTKRRNSAGVYTFSGILRYTNITVTSSDQFTIREKTKYLISVWFFFLMAAIIIVLLVMLLIIKRRGSKRDKFQRRLDYYLEKRKDYRKEEDYERYVERKPEIKRLEEYRPGAVEVPVGEGEKVVKEEDYVVKEYEIKGRDDVIKKYVIKKPIKRVEEYKAEQKPPSIAEAFRRKGVFVYGTQKMIGKKPQPVKMVPAKIEHSVLLNMIQYYRDHGYDKESIKEILMEKKWPEKLVDQYLGMVR